MAWKFMKYNAADFAEAVEKYFDQTEKSEWMIPGLCKFLGITTKTFHNYKVDPAKADVCQMALDMINGKREMLLENGGKEVNGTGIVFLLKNSGYTDTQVQQVKSEVNMNARAQVTTIEEYLSADDCDDLVA